MSECAPSCITMGELANERRLATLMAMLAEGTMIRCDVLSPDVQEFFVVDTLRPDILIPMALIKLPDLTHIFKKAEIHCMRELGWSQTDVLRG